MMKRIAVPVLVLLFIVTLPDIAHACPVCFDANAENRFAFLATTAFMSLFPLSIVGTVGAFLRKRSRDIDAAESDQSALGDDDSKL